MNLLQWTEKYLAIYKKPFIKPSTYEQYYYSLRHIPPELQLEELTPLDLQGIINSMIADKYATSTIKHVKIIISQALKRARQLGYTVGCDFALVDMPKMKKDPVYALSESDQRRIINSIGNSFYGDLFLALLYTGCRVGELIALEWRDIDFKNGFFYIRHTDYHGQLQSPKTDESTRKIPISAEFKSILLRKRVVGISGRVFRNTLGKPVNYRSLLDSWHRLLEIAGLPPVGLHTLRHPYVKLKLKSILNSITGIKILFLLQNIKVYLFPFVFPNGKYIVAYRLYIIRLIYLKKKCIVKAF